MTELGKASLLAVCRAQLLLGVLLFAPAWTLRFPEAWVYWFLWLASVAGITGWFVVFDPALIASRLRSGPQAERDRAQRVIMSIGSVVAIALFVVPGLQHRLRPAHLGWPLVLAGDLLVLTGYGVIFVTFRENGHASSIVEVRSGQRVVDTGPYAVVRHPMYAGALMILLGTPVALGSTWAVPCGVALCLVVAVRLVYEERYLVQHLPGYDAYRGRVTHRLVPFVW